MTRLVDSPEDKFGRSDREWIQTYTGRQFWPLDPRPEEVFLIDIAHALAQQCRFTGHCGYFYCVAQHSVLVSEQAPAGQNPIWGLLHDAPEAYLIDVARPVKHHPAFDFYRQAERKLMGVICERFGLEWPEPAWVKEADDRLLATERRDLMADPPRPWAPGPPPLPQTIYPVGPQSAEGLFLRHFRLHAHRLSLAPGSGVFDGL